MDKNVIFFTHETPHSFFFLIKPSDALISQIYFCQKNSTCFGQFFCPSSGVFHCTIGTGIRVCHAGLMTYTSAESTEENS